MGNSFYSPWGWGGFYDPFWNSGWGWGGYYYPYYGGYHHPIYYNRSGYNGRLSGMIPQNRTNGFRGINSTAGLRNSIRMSDNSNSGIRNIGVRNAEMAPEVILTT
jgi:hypothetical protein